MEGFFSPESPRGAVGGPWLQRPPHQGISTSLTWIKSGSLKTGPFDFNYLLRHVT